MQGCYVCERNAAGNDLHGWERVHDHDHWRFALAFDTSLPGCSRSRAAYGRT